MTAPKRRWEIVCPPARRSALGQWLAPLEPAHRFEAVEGSARGVEGCVAWVDATTSSRVWARLRAGSTVVAVASELAWAFELVRRGARACVEPEAAATWLPLAVTAAPLGLYVWSPAVARRLRGFFDDAADDGPTDVHPTDREAQTLALFARGLSYDEVATALGVSSNTVRSYVRAIYGKLEVTTKTEAVVAARRRGWIPHV